MVKIIETPERAFFFCLKIGNVTPSDRHSGKQHSGKQHPKIGVVSDWQQPNSNLNSGLSNTDEQNNNDLRSGLWTAEQPKLLTITAKAVVDWKLILSFTRSKASLVRIAIAHPIDLSARHKRTTRTKKPLWRKLSIILPLKIIYKVRGNSTALRLYDWRGV